MKDEKIGCLEFLVFLVILGLVFGYIWMVALSDMPDWFKFYLLS